MAPRSLPYDDDAGVRAERQQKLYLALDLDDARARIKQRCRERDPRARRAGFIFACLAIVNVLIAWRFEASDPTQAALHALVAALLAALWLGTHAPR